MDVPGQVRELIAGQLRIEQSEVDERTRLLDLPGIDSLKLMQGLTAIEDHFDIRFDDDGHSLVLQTVGEVVNVVVGKLNGRAARTPRAR